MVACKQIADKVGAIAVDLPELFGLREICGSMRLPNAMR